MSTAGPSLFLGGGGVKGEGSHKVQRSVQYIEDKQCLGLRD